MIPGAQISPNVIKIVITILGLINNAIKVAIAPATKQNNAGISEIPITIINNDFQKLISC